MPPELIRIIFEHLASDMSVLRSLALTSKLFNLEATRLLYASMTLTNGTTHVKFLKTIQKKPELAALVRTYHSPQEPHSQKRPFCPLLVRSLFLMTGLKELAFRTWWVEPHELFPLIKKGRPAPFQLERFIWTFHKSDEFSHVYDKELQQFFEAQPQLRSIRWAGTMLPSKIPFDALPNLEVVEIYWRECSEDSLMDFDSCNVTGALYSQVSENLRGLSLDDTAWPLFLEGDLRTTTLQALQRVEVLEIWGIYEFSEVLPVAQMFPNLKRLTLGNEDVDYDFESSDGGTGPDTWEFLAFFARCSKLIFLDVWCPGPFVSEALEVSKDYFRWVKFALDKGLQKITIPEEQRLSLPSLE